MNELSKEYQKKQEILTGLKEMFYNNPPKFKKFFHEQSITDQANTLAFIQVNDSEFYKDVNEYIGGIKI